MKSGRSINNSPFNGKTTLVVYFIHISEYGQNSRFLIINAKQTEIPDMKVKVKKCVKNILEKET
jgi:hypothetical protein